MGGECGVMGSEEESETAAVSFGPCGVCEAPLTPSSSSAACGIHLFTKHAFSAIAHTEKINRNSIKINSLVFRSLHSQGFEDARHHGRHVPRGALCEYLPQHRPPAGHVNRVVADERRDRRDHRAEPRLPAR